MTISRDDLVRRMGLGTATLMRASSAARRRTVIAAAYEAGIRHFDTAPLYGHGIAERDLGQVLGGGNAPDAAITTKYGRPASAVGRALMGPRRVLRRTPGFQRALARAQSSAILNDAPTRVRGTVEESLQRSLSHLRREEVAALLLHEIRWSEDWSASWLAMQAVRSSALAGAIGVSGPMPLLATYPTERMRDCDIVQAPVWEGKSGLIAGRRLVGFNAFSRVQALEQVVLNEGRVLPPALQGGEPFDALLVTAFLSSHPNATILIGTTSPSRVRRLVRDVQHTVDDWPAHDWNDAWNFIALCRRRIDPLRPDHS